MTRQVLPLVAAASLFFSVSGDAVAAQAEQETSRPSVLTDDQLDSLIAGQAGAFELLVNSEIKHARVAGLAFIIGAFFKFKAHHSNPTFPWLDISGLPAER